MLEFIRSIPGPQFLLYFSLFTLAAVIVGRLIINAPSRGLRMPEPSSFPPSTVAVLRGGWELVIKTVIFGMWQRGLIEIADDSAAAEGKSFRIFGLELKSSAKDNSKVLRRVDGALAPTDRVEMAVWKFLSRSRKPGDVFKDATLRSFVETYVNQTRLELERKGLLKSSGQLRMAWFTFFALLALVMGIGITKLYLGLIYNRPVFILALLLPVALFLLIILLKPWTKLTPLGKQFLKRLEQHFEWLKEAVKGHEKPGVDPAYAFAIFGTTVLAGTLLYASFSEAFPSRTSSNSGCGGGSCGGSSCSGGGCSGGGGCGGCGGGD